MNYTLHTTTIDLGDGQPITIETGKLAKQAHGSVVVRMGDTMLLATVVSSYEAKAGVDFFPLTVDYREKYSSTGRFPGGFLKREARPSDSEILTMRLVDRALRPLFPDGYHNETQVMIQLISSDKEHMPDALACLAASAAIAVSDIQFGGPVSEVRVARINGEFKINPTFSQLEQADMDMIIAGTEENIVMVEGEMSECSEKEMLEAIAIAHSAIKVHCRKQLELAANVPAAQTKREIILPEEDEALKAAVFAATQDKFLAVAKEGNPNKNSRKESFGAIKEEYISTVSEEEMEEKGGLVKKYLSACEKAMVRKAILEDGIRLDGRKTTEIRPIWCEVDYLPGAHGSAIFTRGETQSLTTITLGSKMDQQMIDGALVQDSLKFILHYNFPPFSTGEARPIRGVSRREIGHGNLAQRALKQVIPERENNPYTMRLVSDILESNGSSSMATVCAGTLAMMDAGIDIKAPVSGIAMGLITDEKGNFAVLSDILGDEDHLGDMDFKVTGTTEGITACQMDIKVEGLSFEVLEQALLQARDGRLHILGEMAKTISEPRKDYKEHAPRIVTVVIPQDTIGAVIGPGGKIIQEIQRETGATVALEEIDGQGVVEIFADSGTAMEDAKKRITDIAFPPKAEIGEVYEGKVKSIMPYGAFVEVVPGTDALLHISEIEWSRLEKVEDVLKEGDIIKVKVTGLDPKTKKLKLSRKVLLPKPERKEETKEDNSTAEAPSK